MNSSAKGKRNENKSDKYLADQGLVVLNTIRSGRRGLNNDFFNLWDHIAFSPETGHTYYVQTKTNSISKKAFNDHTDHIAKFKKGCSGIVMVWIDRVKTPRIYVTTKPGQPLEEIDAEFFTMQIRKGRKL